MNEVPGIQYARGFRDGTEWKKKLAVISPRKLSMVFCTMLG